MVTKDNQQSIFEEIAQNITGELVLDDKTLTKFEHDTSMFEIKPQAVVFPKNINDVESIVKIVAENKARHPELSITARSAGTDMSGGAINDSIILVFDKYFTHIGPFRGQNVWTEPGVHYKQFEKATLKHKLIFPSYPASREICAMGGIVSNNSGGEKSLAYGKTENHVTEIRAVLSDGNEYEFGPLSKTQLQAKLHQKNFEGELYRKIYKLVDENYELIKKSRPQVSKNSTGYNVWNVWDRDKEIFDMGALLVGAQGTLGLVTAAELGLVEHKTKSALLIMYVPSLEQLPDIINTVVPFKPTSFEAFDEHTFALSLKFFPSFRKTLGCKGLPKFIMLVEFEGDSKAEVNNKIDQLAKQLDRFDLTSEKAKTKINTQKYWLMRRESFNLLRHNVKHRHTAPFIDDLVVPPQNLPQFWPKLTKILEKYDLLYTIAGHMGDGNFHIIPLMDLSDPKERAKLEPCQKQVNELVISYGGSISGEHNDGLVRGPFLSHMYSPAMMHICREIKTIFDAHNIFNPHKKTDASWKYSFSHIRQGFE
jgi:FAD/FMN-containing dehydrogenase